MTSLADIPTFDAKAAVIAHTKASEIASQVDAVATQVRDLPITNDGEAQVYAQGLRSIKEQGKAIDDLRKRLVGPIKDVAKFIDGIFMPHVKRLKDLEQQASRRLGDFERRRAEELERREREERARKEAELKKAAEEAEAKEREAQAAREAAAADAPETGDCDLDAALALAEAEVEADRLEQEAEAANARAAEIAAAPVVDAAAASKTSALTAGALKGRKVWKAELIDAAAVPREYCQPHMPSINQAVRDGVREIPGVRIFEHTEYSR